MKRKMTKLIRLTQALTMLFIIQVVAFPVVAIEEEKPITTASETRLSVSSSVMCEEIKDGKPVNVSAVFSKKLDRINCYTRFKPLDRDTTFFEDWYRRDKLNTRKTISLKPNSTWTYAGIFVQESDMGPWRVEITNENGDILHVLRFSITD